MAGGLRIARDRGRAVLLAMMRDPYCRAQDLLCRGRYRASAEAFSALAGRSARVAEAHTLDLIGRFEEALRCCDRVVEEDPGDPDGWYMQGVVLFHLGRFHESSESYDRTLAIEPDRAEAWYGKGNNHYQLGNFAVSADCFAQALRIDPGYGKAWYNRGVACADMRDHEEAVRCYEEYRAINPAHLSAVGTNIGVSLSYLGRYEEALDCFDEVLAENPSDEYALHNRAVTLMRMGRGKEAEEAFSRAAEITRTRQMRRVL
ncbi:MAG: tetratricopeptide repeat protein [Methanomicrobiaceae archaeon]|nr:tetratricopeptide repeat protein [Methanomicrobiaceae archaeon]